MIPCVNAIAHVLLNAMNLEKPVLSDYELYENLMDKIISDKCWYS